MKVSEQIRATRHRQAEEDAIGYHGNTAFLMEKEGIVYITLTLNKQSDGKLDKAAAQKLVASLKGKKIDSARMAPSGLVDLTLK